MKFNRIYMLSILAFMLIIFAIEYNLPKKFVWTPSYAHYDHQPFGCAVFDDVLTASFPDGYSTTDQSFYQLADDSTSTVNILSISNQLQLGKADADALIQMAERGSRIVLAAAGFNPMLYDTLGFDNSYEYFNSRTFKKYASGASPRDTIHWLADSRYPATPFFVYPHLCQSTFSQYDSLNIALAVKEYMENDTTASSAPIAITQKRGKGEITLVSTPLLFTNYGVLDNKNATYLFRILNSLQGNSLVRTEAYIPSAGILAKDQTPLRYILSQQPLRWAIYGTMLVVLLCMVFTARRRQRVIPVIKEPENKTIEFITLIGTLYWQRKDHTDLLCKKYIYFAEQLRRTIQVDIEEDADDAKLAQKISDKTGIEKSRIHSLLQRIRPIVKGTQQVNEEEMQLSINEMNEIITHTR